MDSGSGPFLIAHSGSIWEQLLQIKLMLMGRMCAGWGVSEWLSVHRDSMFACALHLY